MLATNQNHLITQEEEPKLAKNSLIKLLTYAVNDVQNRRIVICLTLDIVGDCPEKIGEPKAIEPTRQESAQPEQHSNAVPSNPPPAPAAARTSGNGVGGSNASKTSAAKRGGVASRAGGGRAGGSNIEAPIYPIESLSPYQNKSVHPLHLCLNLLRAAANLVFAIQVDDQS